MAAKKMSKTKRGQKELPIEGPGAGPVRIPDIDDAAENYVKARDARMRLTRREVETKDALIKTLKDHKKELGTDGEGSMFYEYDDIVVELTPVGEQLKVRARVDEED